MSKIKIQLQELRAKNSDELVSMLATEREALRALRFKVHTQEVKQVHLVKAAHKRIAHLLTLLKHIVIK
ncbi:MAG: 50S ribosomal protein L29 [Candidatus Magasanikbacteria bacterium]|nr:50S ribosomal protein L29 [Candidatus Magasanikbacteria bacterium]